MQPEPLSAGRAVGCEAEARWLGALASGNFPETQELNHGGSITGITLPETETDECAEGAEHACMK